MFIRTIPFLLATGLISAQSSAQEHLTIGVSDQTLLRRNPSKGLLLRSAGDTVFHEDFALGLAGNNGAGAWTQSGTNGSMWKYDMDGPLGAFSSLSEVITSTTAGNGFMIFDADRANSDTTIFPPAPLTTFTAWDGYLTSPILDLTTTPEVHLTFQMRLRWCCSQAVGHFVDVSTDGGLTWPTRFDAPVAGHAFNFDPGTYSVDINLTPVILNTPSEVRFRFSWAGSTINNSHYHWQLDDIALTISPDVGLPEENTLEGLAVFAPNPCTEATIVSLDTPAGDLVEWSLLDLQGIAVLTGESTDARFPVQVGHLVPGTYVFQTRSAGSVRFGRLVVMH